MVIVDSSVWIDLLRGTANAETGWLLQEMSEQLIGITSLSLCEVLQGVRDSVQFLHYKRDLMRYQIFETGSAALALHSAENYLALRRQGVTVRKTVDCLIATFCIDEGHELLHRDRDFDHFEKHLGLQVVHP